jgi:hypothetical protein
MLRVHLSVLGLAIGAILGAIGMARACGLDGVPSLLVNGRLVVANRALPVQGQLAKWAPFVAPGVYPTGQPVLLQEIRGRLLGTLPPSAFRTPWHWTFGDGTLGQGIRIRHRYRRHGTYVVGVQAYLVNGQASAWYLFDSLVIRVR